MQEDRLGFHRFVPRHFFFGPMRRMCVRLQGRTAAAAAKAAQ